MYQERESNKHLLAKNLFASWFKGQESESSFCKVAQFEWRSNYGVHEELKFHEKDNPYYFELSGGLVGNPSWPAKIVDHYFDPRFDRGQILFVPDITVFHKGTPKYLFEIVVSNPLSESKIRKIERFFDGFYVEVHEVAADHILSFDKSEIPQYIQTNQVK